MKLKIVAELLVDDTLSESAISDEDSERDWFYNHLLTDELHVFSNLIGDSVGSLVIREAEAIDE